MPYVQQYTFLDGKWHAIGWSEHTQCNLEIPFGNGYGPLPDKAKAHCGPDTKIAEDSTDDDPAANKAVADEEAAKRVGLPVESVTGEAAEEAPAKPAAKATKKG
jgi:hypothetical protein